jgi:hypothetical protein
MQYDSLAGFSRLDASSRSLDLLAAGMRDKRCD